jgi:integrase
VIDDYRQSTDWTRLAAQSQRAYARQLDWLLTTAGHNQIASLTRPRARQLIEERAKNRAGTHNIFLAVLRVVILHAIELELLTHDPTLKMRRMKMGEHRAWTAEECATFEAHWPTGSRERLAYMLGRHTGQRLGDVAKMTWGDIGLNGVKVIQEKTGTKLTIPLHRDLKAELALHPRKGVTIVSQGNGARLSKDGMKSFTHRAIREAGLGTECVFHGLRKLAAGSMAEMGCTAIEIASITGHKSLSEVERYTRGASQITLATAAMRKMESK